MRRTGRRRRCRDGMASPASRDVIATRRSYPSRLARPAAGGLPGARDAHGEPSARVRRSARRCATSRRPHAEAFLVSTAVVALGEIGDKTQLLALMLAARYRAAVADRRRHPRRDARQPHARRLRRQLGAHASCRRTCCAGSLALSFFARRRVGAEARQARRATRRRRSRASACSASPSSRSSWPRWATRRRSPRRCSRARFDSLVRGRRGHDARHADRRRAGRVRRPARGRSHSVRGGAHRGRAAVRGARRLVLLAGVAPRMLRPRRSAV